MTRTGIVWDARYLKHDTGPGHPESPKRLLAVKEVLDSDSKLVPIKPRLATSEEVAWVHSRDHIKNVDRMNGVEHAYFDLDTPASAGSTEAAYLAVGGMFEAINAVCDNRVSNAFHFPRPPGHHAESNRAMGFCLFNNVALGAEFLIRKKGKKRVAIVDIDVHHGNGTQHFFYERSDVFYISSHRFPFYPGTGARDERGKGEGYGYTLNLPYDAGSDDDDYKKGYEEEVVSSLINYKPDFVLVSAGFDAHIRDPLGGMRITKKGFTMMSQTLFDVVKECCEGKIVFVLEGGYDMKGLKEGVEAVLEVLGS